MSVAQGAQGGDLRAGRLRHVRRESEADGPVLLAGQHANSGDSGLHRDSLPGVGRVYQIARFQVSQRGYKDIQ